MTLVEFLGESSCELYPLSVLLLPGHLFYEDSWYKADLNKYHTLTELYGISSELGIFLWSSPD